MSGSRSRRPVAERNDLALLQAAQAVLELDGVHATVAAIAARAGVGIGSLYRRYRTKGELLQHLCFVSLEQYRKAAEEGLTRRDPWEGLAFYFKAATDLGVGSLAAVAGTIAITPEMATSNDTGDRAVAELVRKAHEAGVLRPDVNDVDISLLIEQLGRSPLIELLTAQDRPDLRDAALNARARIIAIALEGLRTSATELPGTASDRALFAQRWVHPK